MSDQKQGRIIRGIGGFYYVLTKENGVYECKAKGIFRNRHIKPLVGDWVMISVLSEDEKTGSIDEILPRKTELFRPAVANVDQAIVIFAAKDPETNLNLLDRFLIEMEKKEIPSIICFNKADLVSTDRMNQLVTIYEKAGYPVVYTSVKQEENGEDGGIRKLREYLLEKTSTVAGPSGVGKSSLTNLLQSNITMETGVVSEKIGRGRHTTRRAELIRLDKDSFMIDTPGFSSFSVDEMDANVIKKYYKEIRKEEHLCRFQGCAHIHEPDCGVKDALNEGRISRERYENYVLLYEECKGKRRY